LFGPLFALGYTIVVPDTEGPDANFAAGPEYGMMTLDALRAAKDVPETGITDDAEIALMGYSGGAIATNWASILAPAYAPEINDNLIGARRAACWSIRLTTFATRAEASGWAGVVGMAIVGVARSYDIDFGKYLSDRGRDVMARLEDASIGNVLAQYPGLTWQELVKPEYADPNTVPEYVDVVNKINMGTAATPTIPMFIAQAANGTIEGTQPGGPGVGAGDGVMTRATSVPSHASIATPACRFSTTSTTPSATSSAPCSGSPVRSPDRRPIHRQACSVELREYRTGELSCAAGTCTLADRDLESTSTAPPPSERELPTVPG
jgi:hypothetical protein